MAMNQRVLIAKILAAVLLLAGIAAAEPVYIAPADVDWQSLLGAPPEKGSDQEKQEIATLLQWQAKRTASDVDRCKSEEAADPFIFSELLGDKFSEQQLPITGKLLRDVQNDVKAFTKLAKAKWDRKRPPLVDPRIHPCVTKEENASYPSAHATRGVVWSRILAEMFPDKKDQLLARGLLIGKDRYIAGIHFPSDVEAGQKLGNAIADKLLADPAFVRSMKEAKEECDKAGIQ
jgi:acid phosphatase (class A)